MWPPAAGGSPLFISPGMEKMEKLCELDTINIVRKLPQDMIIKILCKLDLESLCVSASVCRSLRASVLLALSSLSSLDLTEFSPKLEIVDNLMRNNKIIQSLKLDCVRLDESSIYLFLKESLEELVLLRCFNFSSNICTAIGEKCPKLRIVMLDVRAFGFGTWNLDVFGLHSKFVNAVQHMVNSCMLLESLHIQFPNMRSDLSSFKNHKLFLPKLMKKLFIEPTVCEQALLLIPMCSGLQSLTLVLDDITDELPVSISQNLPKLTELCLADKLKASNAQFNDNLSNNGIHAIRLCRNLKRLSLTRGSGCYNYPEVSFARVNDAGILQLANGLDQLEFLKLSGFSNVTDAGYISIIHSCKKLRSLEIKYSNLLSDLAFKDFLNNTPRHLVDVRLTKCNLLTGGTAAFLSCCENLKDLDLSGCKNIDLGLRAISKLRELVKLDLSGADLSDNGLLSLRVCSSPIAYLSLRGCKRITGRGMSLLFNGESSITKTLVTLDVENVGLMGMSDQVIATISENCKQLANLSIRDSFFVTDASIKDLGLKTIPIRRLDLYGCHALSVKSFEYLSLPYFKKLRWLGVRLTALTGKIPWGTTNITLGDGLVNLLAGRCGLSLCVSGCGLSLCVSGCEMHCNVGYDGCHIRTF